MNIKEYLNYPMRLSVLIRCKKKRLNWMRENAKISQGPMYGEDKVQTSPLGKSLVQVTAIELATFAEDIEQNEKELEIVTQRVKDLIYSLDSTDESLVLEMRFLSGLEWKEIVSYIGYSERKVYKLYDSALQHATERYNALKIQ